MSDLCRVWLAPLLPMLDDASFGALRACDCELRSRADSLWMLGLLRDSLGPRVGLGGARLMVRAVRRLDLLRAMRYMIAAGPKVTRAFRECARSAATVTTAAYFDHKARVPYDLRDNEDWWIGRRALEHFSALVNTRRCFLAHTYCLHDPEGAQKKYGFVISRSENGLIDLLAALVPDRSWGAGLLLSMLARVRVTGPAFLEQCVHVHLDRLRVLRLKQGWRALTSRCLRSCR